MTPYSPFAESDVESAALEWLAGLGYSVLAGPDIAPDGPTPERAAFGQVVLEGRLRDALARLNPKLPPAALEDAFAKIARPAGADLLSRNHAVHRLLVDGVTVEYTRRDGSIAGAQARLLDYDDPDNNDWLAANQLTVVEGQHNRRPDIVLYVNGLPLAVIELKNAADESADIWAAFNQLQTYKAQIPGLFVYNAALVISDGLNARLGSLTAPRGRFQRWRTVAGVEQPGRPDLETLLRGVFDRARFLDYVRHFVVFEDEGGGDLVKKLAAYHQFDAVNQAVEETLRAGLPAEEPLLLAEGKGGYWVGPGRDAKPGDRRIGVVWHTQGSGKSLTMAFYAGRVILHPQMANPTLVVITDRNDLDDQLFGVFARCQELLRQPPVQAAGREDLRAKLRVDAGGVVFTTLQKFMPEKQGDPHPLLTERRNVVVIADEAHRSQYDFIDGFAFHLREALPNASFIGFTGTPIEAADRDTRAVFGGYLARYDIARAVEDGATVPIYYQSRLAQLALDEQERPRIDPDFAEVTEGEEEEVKERVASKWAQLEALVGADRRIRRVAADLAAHLEERWQTIEGKAMIVCMSRRICVQLYDALAALRPEWHGEEDGQGRLKVIMTGSASDPLEMQPHIRSKPRREKLAERFRDPADPFQIVIVRDMWLTGFDAPSLHTMYVDKPMQGHGLMQAIARVNRVYQDKPGGLVVDYLGIAEQLSAAMRTYAESEGEGEIKHDQEEAVAELVRYVEVCRGLFHGFDWSAWAGGGSAARLRLLCNGQEHILRQSEGKQRYLDAVQAVTRAFALAAPHEQTRRLREEVGFYQAVRAALRKRDSGARRAPAELDHAVRQIVSRAIVADEMIDIFAAAGLRKPELSILSEEFLAQVQAMPQRNLAVEVLRKLLAGEIRSRGQRNAVQARSFAERLETAVRGYQARTIENAEIIDALIDLARQMRTANDRGEQLRLSEDELAFYDALAANESAVQVMGDEALAAIARELVAAVRKNVTIDWTLRENVRANLRAVVKRILRRRGYPPDKREQAANTVLEQAELLSGEWAVAQAA